LTLPIWCLIVSWNYFFVAQHPAPPFQFTQSATAVSASNDAVSPIVVTVKRGHLGDTTSCTDVLLCIGSRVSECFAQHSEFVENIPYDLTADSINTWHNTH
jgi:hypothetical protein